MTAGKRVVFAFLRSRERTDTIQLSVRIEQVASSRKNLMSISLMSNVPHNAIIGCVIDIVQGNCNLNNT